MKEDMERALQKMQEDSNEIVGVVREKIERKNLMGVFLKSDIVD